ncbi:MAG TPA: DNA mismatch repair endonuclease MutL [Euryarchaeota archaeon]|nr:DNA mismatch repair endonuclease MutL [Euryarchaeota archaeon]
MGRIRKLDPQTVNEIAAGEVVERPASVVKELIENSIDARARRIEVRVEDGGKRTISVIDDGEGMSSEDALVSIGQHSTSKISGIDDLDRLRSYGFRGEALASIASVSRMTLRTRHQDDQSGTEISTEFGSEPSVTPVGAPVGTTVTVENLFANVPARLKHLASTKTELSHITSAVIRYAVAWPEISFDLYSEGKLLQSFRGPDLASRLTELIGVRAAKRLIDISAESEGASVDGKLTAMDVTRSSSSSIYLYVNRRPVTSPLILSAVADGYGTRLMKGRHPLGSIMIEVPPGSVDVNVHPTKREVRFAEPEKIRQLIVQAIDSSFRHEDPTPRLGDLMDYTKIGRSEGRAESSRSADLSRPMQTRLEEEEPAEASFPLEPLTQLLRTYIIATGADSDSLILIDQHAAAERIQYERILSSVKQGDDRSQRLIAPVMLDLASDEKNALEENMEHLRSLGFEMEPFGGGSYRLIGVPVVLGQEQGERALRGVLSEIVKADRRRPLGEELIWKVACHGSVRAGEELTRSQMRDLISSLLRTDNPYTCEHGRPTMISLTTGDLERLFKRRV